MIGLLERTEFEGRICPGGGIERSGGRLEASDERRARCSPSSGCVARRLHAGMVYINDRPIA
jgi:hypothetical protein